MLKGLEKCLKFSFIVHCKYLFGILRLIRAYFCTRWNNVSNLKPEILKQKICANSIYFSLFKKIRVEQIL